MLPGRRDNAIKNYWNSRTFQAKLNSIMEDMDARGGLPRPIENAAPVDIGHRHRTAEDRAAHQGAAPPPQDEPRRKRQKMAPARWPAAAPAPANGPAEQAAALGGGGGRLLLWAGQAVRAGAEAEHPAPPPAPAPAPAPAATAAMDPAQQLTAAAAAAAAAAGAPAPIQLLSSEESKSLEPLRRCGVCKKGVGLCRRPGTAGHLLADQCVGAPATGGSAHQGGVTPQEPRRESRERQHMAPGPAVAPSPASKQHNYSLTSWCPVCHKKPCSQQEDPSQQPRQKRQKTHGDPWPTHALGPKRQAGRDPDPCGRLERGQLPAVGAAGAEQYVVESVTGKRRMGSTIEYQVRWRGYDDLTWEPAANLHQAQQAIDDFEEAQTAGAAASAGVAGAAAVSADPWPSHMLGPKTVEWGRDPNPCAKLKRGQLPLRGAADGSVNTLGGRAPRMLAPAPAWSTAPHELLGRGVRRRVVEHRMLPPDGQGVAEADQYSTKDSETPAQASTRIGCLVQDLLLINNIRKWTTRRLCRRWHEPLDTAPCSRPVLCQDAVACAHPAPQGHLAAAAGAADTPRASCRPQASRPSAALPRRR